MVRDGYYYGCVLLASALLVGWLTKPAWAAIPVFLAAFFLWFFRDPQRAIPNDPGAVVSPADGKVTDVPIQIGSTYGSDVEVTSGLAEGDTVLLPATTSRASVPGSGGSPAGGPGFGPGGPLPPGI